MGNESSVRRLTPPERDFSIQVVNTLKAGNFKFSKGDLKIFIHWVFKHFKINSDSAKSGIFWDNVGRKLYTVQAKGDFSVAKFFPVFQNIIFSLEKEGKKEEGVLGPQLNPPTPSAPPGVPEPLSLPECQSRGGHCPPAQSCCRLSDALLPSLPTRAAVVMLLWAFPLPSPLCPHTRLCVPQFLVLAQLALAVWPAPPFCPTPTPAFPPSPLLFLPRPAAPPPPTASLDVIASGPPTPPSIGKPLPITDPGPVSLCRGPVPGGAPTPWTQCPGGRGGSSQSGATLASPCSHKKASSRHPSWAHAASKHALSLLGDESSESSYSDSEYEDHCAEVQREATRAGNSALSQKILAFPVVMRRDRTGAQVAAWESLHYRELQELCKAAEEHGRSSHVF
ncbi:proline-rich protein 12-like [Parus major]|uniref:proline-rich protein 12-like n=1 Tax=Parus major TaxID=9157 RepID=UPI001443F108|nr:proline-rich protein 12-like [Parus major]